MEETTEKQAIEPKDSKPAASATDAPAAMKKIFGVYVERVVVHVTIVLFLLDMKDVHYHNVQKQYQKYVVLRKTVQL